MMKNKQTIKHLKKKLRKGKNKKQKKTNADSTALIVKKYI